MFQEILQGDNDGNNPPLRVSLQKWDSLLSLQTKDFQNLIMRV
jgi:hypothetical protein